MHIIHFDVDETLKKYLKETCLSFPLSLKNLKKISSRKSLEIISITSSTTIDKDILKHFPNLKLIITRSVGLDHIDLKTCKKRRVLVYNIPDYGPYNIAEYAIALLLTGARNIIQAVKSVHQGKFSYKKFLGVSLKEKTLGVIGTGKIGIEFIKLAKAFGVKILAYDINKNDKRVKELGFNYVNLNKLLAASDFISLHVPLSAETKHLIREKEIKLMKKGVVLVNTSRGAIIDTQALIKNIKKFKAVCLDVLENENEFSKSHELLQYNNVIITPHMAFYTDASVKKIANETEKLILNFIRNHSVFTSLPSSSKEGV